VVAVVLIVERLELEGLVVVVMALIGREVAQLQQLVTEQLILVAVVVEQPQIVAQADQAAAVLSLSNT
jgi:hypothetical protein